MIPVKLRQTLDEWLLLGESPTLEPRLLRAAYRSLVLQTSRRQQSACIDEILEVDFLGRRLACFHRPSVLSLFREIFLYQHYNPIQPLPERPVVVDLGANIGLFTLYAGLVYPGARILAFEADPLTFRALERNVERYAQGARVTLHNVALSDAAGIATVQIDRENPNRCTNTIVDRMLTGFSSDGPARGAQVACARLSSYTAELDAIHLLKVDIEGSEFAVLSDLVESGELAKCENVICEVHRNAFGAAPGGARGHGLATLFGWLEDAGFELDVLGQGRRPFCSGSVTENLLVRAFRPRTV